MGINSEFGKVGVLMGGPSTERDISLKSGHAVLDSLQRQEIDAVEIDIKSADRSRAAELIASFSIDCAFIALHGAFGEDGRIQSILEELKLPYTGSGVKASATAMDKIAAKKVFRDNGLRVARQAVIEKSSYRPPVELDPGFGLPWVIKPATGGSSIGLSVVDSADQVRPAIESALAFDGKALVEEYIKGRELTVGILDNRPLCVIEIVTKNRFFDFQAKYQHGFTEYIVPAKLEEKTALRAQEAALSAHRCLGCFGFSRVDIMLDPREDLYVLEVNTIPGLTSTSLLPKAAKFAGIDFDRLCLILLRSAYEKK